MAKRYNMRLVLKQRFSEFFQEKVKKEQHRSLMMKMMALEVKLLINNQQSVGLIERRLSPVELFVVFQPFPGEDGGRQEADGSEEYSHAKEHCGRAGVRLPLVGLLTAYSLICFCFCSNCVVVFVCREL